MSQEEFDFQDPLVEYQEAFNKLEDSLNKGNFPEPYRRLAIKHLKLRIYKGVEKKQIVEDQEYLASYMDAWNEIKKKHPEVDIKDVVLITERNWGNSNGFDTFLYFHAKPGKTEKEINQLANNAYTEMRKRYDEDCMKYESLKNAFNNNKDLVYTRSINMELEKYEKESNE